MIDYFFSIENYFLYLVCFPFFFLFLLFLFFIRKRGLKKNKVAFYGMFMGLSTRNILSLSFLLAYYYVVIVSLFIHSFSMVNLFIIILPIILCHLFNFSMFHLIVDFLHTLIIFFLLYSESILYNYIIEVGNYWYVVALHVLLCIFISFYVSLIVVKRFKLIISHNKYIKETKKRKDD